jgi:hypothetical protein
MQEKPPRKRRQKGTPYGLLLLGVCLALLGLRQGSQLLMGLGAALFAMSLLIGYARTPPTK